MSFAVGQIITPFLFSSPRTSLSGRWVAARDSGKDSPIAQLYLCPSRTTLKNVSDFFCEVDKVGESLPWSCRLEATMMTLLPPFLRGRGRERERERKKGRKWKMGRGREGRGTHADWLHGEEEDRERVYRMTERVARRGGPI